MSSEYDGRRAWLWEILVPTLRNGDPVKTRSHKEWDTRVRRISGGLTIFKPAKGEWISPSGEIFAERMIPVRIMCTREEINKIADMTAAFYNQEAIMFFLVSQETIIKTYPLKEPKK